MKGKILVVEDNEQNMVLEADLLENAGFEVLRAFNAADGIEIALKEKPDAIVMDVRLPDMYGTEAVKILRQNQSTCDIPIIFVTAFVIGEGLERVKNISNCGYISKPIDTRTFVQEVSKHIK